MWSFARLCVLSLGLVAVPVAAQNTPPEEDGGGGFLENLIENRLSSEGFQVQVRGFQGALSSRATVERITIADAEGVWLTINDAVLDWNRSALLRGRLSVDELAAAEIIVPRLPERGDRVNVPQPEAQPFSLPELPVAINIGQINAERIELGQPVIGEEAVVTLEGSAQLANGEGQVDVRVERIDDERGIFQIAGSYENASRQLEVDVELEEGPDGIVANLIDLPGRPSLSARIEGVGPISEFNAEIDLDTDGEDRLDGTVALREVDGVNGFALDLSGDVTALFAPSYRPFFGPNVSLEAQGARLPDGAITLDGLSLQSQAMTLQGEVRIGADNVPTLIDVTGVIASEDGSPVLLPVGQEIRVDHVVLDVNFDASESEEWSGELVIEGLDRPGLQAERVALDGSGIISGSGETLDVEAGFDFTAAGLSLEDEDLEAALGDEIGGRIDLSYAAGEPIVLSTFDLSGASFVLDGSGQVDPAGENLPISFTGALDAEDLSIFSGLVGRPLDGTALLDVDLTFEALSGAFDVSLQGRTQELEVGVPQLDPLLTGATLLDVAAVRNEAGLNVERLVLRNEQIDVNGSAALTSQGGTAELDARIDDLSRIDPTLSGPATLTATAERPADAWQIELDFQGAEAVVTGEATIQDLEAASPLAVFDLAVVADDLSTFGAILDRPLGGAADLSAQGQARLDLSNGNVVLSGTTTDIEIGQEEVDRLLAGETEIDLRLRREGPQFTVPALTIRNPQVVATGEGFYGEGQSAIEARILLDELGDIVPEMSGPADISLVAREEEEGWDVDFDATGTGARIAVDGTVEDLRAEGVSPMVAGVAEVAVADLSVFSSLANRELAGTVDLSLTGGTRFDLSEASIDAEGTTRNLEIGIEEIDRLLAGVTELRIDAAKDGDVINVNDLLVENPQIIISGSGDIAPGDSTAQLRVQLDELADVIPEMQGPATITLDATEEGDAWALDLDATGAGARVVADVTVEDLRTEGISPLVAGTAEVAVDDLSVFSSLANRELAGTVDLSLDGRGRLDLSEASIDAEGTTRNLEIGIEEIDRLLAGVTELRIDAAKDGDVINVNDLLVENPQIIISGSGDIAPGDSTAQLRVRLDELSDVIPQMQGPGTITLDASEEGDAWALDLDATGAGARVVADVTVEDLRTEGVSPLVAGTAEVAVDDLRVFSSLADRELAGTVDLSLDGRGRFDLSEVSVDAEGTTRNLEIGIEEIDRLLAGVTELRVDAVKDGDVIDIQELLIQNPQITVSGSGDIAPGDSSARLQVQLDELGDVVPEMRGPAVIILDVTEDGETWVLDLDATGAGARVVADATVEDLRTEGVSPLVDGTAEVEVADLGVFSRLADRDLGGAVDLSLDGRARLDLSQASVVASGTTRNLAISQPEVDRLLRGLTTLQIDAEKNGDTVLIQELRIGNPQITAVAEGSYGGPGGNAIQADVTLAELSNVVPGLTGPADLNLVAEETGDRWQVALDGDGAGVVIDLLGEVRELEATPVFDGRVNLRAQDISRFSRFAGQPLSGSVNLQAEGSARFDASRFDVTANAQANNLRMGVPQLDQLLAGGTTNLSLAASRTGANAPIRVERFQLDAPGLDAQANGAILGGASNLTINARLENLGNFVPNLNGPLTAQGRVGQSGSNLTLDVALTGPQGVTARLDGTVAESFDRANIDISGTSPLRLVNPFLGNRALSGAATYNLSLNGPLALTSLTGTVTVADGRLVDPNVPFVLNDIDGTARLQGNQVTVNVTAAKQEGGRLAAAGTIGLTAGFPADLGIEVNRVVHEDPRLYRTIANGRVTLTGPLTGGAVIGGTLMIGQTEIRIPSTGLGVRGRVPDGLVHVNEPEDVRRTRARADLIEEDGDDDDRGPAVVYGLDLTILAADEIFIRGRGLDAELGGVLTLAGTTANVIPTGRFELIRGRIDLLGQRITLTQGFVTLAGDFTPIVRLVAETETADDVTVRIVVEGELTEPDITFSSDPDLPEDEVLSRLLFGRSIENISALQAAQLANAVATLSGRGGIGIVDNLRESTGLDDLDVTTDEEGNVGVQAGAYLSENVYSSVNVDSEGEAVINLNLDLTESITVRGSASNDGETSLGVFFERDY